MSFCVSWYGAYHFSRAAVGNRNFVDGNVRCITRDSLQPNGGFKSKLQTKTEIIPFIRHLGGIHFLCSFSLAWLSSLTSTNMRPLVAEATSPTPYLCHIPMPFSTLSESTGCLWRSHLYVACPQPAANLHYCQPYTKHTYRVRRWIEWFSDLNPPVTLIPSVMIDSCLSG